MARRIRFTALEDGDCQRLHDAALELLENTGIQAPPAVLEALRARDFELSGAARDRLHLPRGAVAAALANAPRTVSLGARGPGRSLLLDGTRTYAATDGCGSKALDPETGALRPSILADVARSARLADALPQFDLYWMMISAQDIPRGERVAREYLAALRNCTKHIQMIDVARRAEAEILVRMAQVLAQEGVVEGAPVSALISVVSPLRLDPEGIEAALVFSRAGLPVVCCSMPIASVTAPATPAGNLVLAHAECVAMITVLQILQPGAPVIYCSFATYADPRTGATTYHDPRKDWTAAVAAQLGRRLGIPCFASGGPLAMLIGPDLVSGGGMIETSTVLADEQLVMDDEALRNLRLAALAPGLDAEDLALDVIQAVGPGGNFLASRHTLRHIREYVVSRYADGDRGLARAEARRLLATHSVPPLPEQVDRALEQLAGTAGAQAQ